MNRTERLAALLLYLQSRRGERNRATAAEIAAHFGISRRTVLRDMAALSAMEVPVDAADGPHGGFSLAEDFPLAPLPLNAREVQLLLFALDGLERLPAAPFGDSRSTLTQKLRALLSRSQRDLADRHRETLSLQVPERPGLATPFLDALVAAAQRAAWVRVRYRSESGEEAEHALHPIQISADRGFWYCRAWSHERGAERTFRVDRFLAVQPTEAPADAALIAAAAVPYDHPDHPEIDVFLTPRGVAMAEAEQHVGRLVTRDSDGCGRLTFRCPPSEMEYWGGYFLRLAPHAAVNAPVELRRRIRELAEKIAMANTDR